MCGIKPFQRKNCLSEPQKYTSHKIPFPTREEGYLADQEPAVSKVEFAAEDLSRPATQREGDGSG